MLSARYLAGCSDDLVKLYSQLETDILVSIAKKLKKLGNPNETMKYQAQILTEIGSLTSDIQNKISKYDAKAQKMILDLFNNASDKATGSDLQRFEEAKRNMTEGQIQTMKANAEKVSSAAIINANKKTRRDFAEGQAIKVFSGLHRLTMTIADSSSAEFVNKANQVYMQVSSGAFSYQEAFKNAVDDLASSNIKTVQYTDSGKIIKRTIESAVRTNILSGINQTVSQITINNASDLGTDLVEVSAHIGARPTHEAWQGKIYSLSGTSEKYPPFSVCHFGEADGICGINCRHSFYPFFEGISEPLYSDGQLDEYKDATVEYKGQTMTRYQAEQTQRLYERAIRRWKRTADTQNAVGVDSTLARIKLGEWQKKQREFCEETGLRRDYAREYIGVVGTTNGNQPKGKTLESILPY